MSSMKYLISLKTYKDLQGKKTEIGEWEGPEEAAKLIDECIARYQKSIISKKSSPLWRLFFILN